MGRTMKELRVKRAAVLDALDDAELVRGYMLGFDGGKLPIDANLSFKHGWRNGMSDSGRRPIDRVQRELAADVVATGYLRKLFTP